MVVLDEENFLLSYGKFKLPNMEFDQGVVDQKTIL